MRFFSRFFAASLAICLALSAPACFLDWDLKASSSGGDGGEAGGGIEDVETINCSTGQTCTCSGTKPCKLICAGTGCTLLCGTATKCETACNTGCNIQCGSSECTVGCGVGCCYDCSTAASCELNCGSACSTTGCF